MSPRSLVYSLLRKGEKYARTDLVYLAKGGLWLFAGQVIASVFSFASAIAFANLVAKEDYGVYKYILAIAGIINAFSLTGLDTSVSQSVARGDDSVLPAAVRASLRWNILIFLAALAGGGYYFLNGNTLLGFGILIVAFTSPIINSFTLYNGFLIGKKNFRATTGANAARTITTTTTLIALIFLAPQEPLLFVGAYFFVNAALHFLFYVRVTSSYRVPAGRPHEDMIAHGKHLSAMNVLLVVADYADKILLFHFLGGVGLATYTVALAPVGQALGLIKLVNPLAMPKIAAQDKEVLKKTVPRKIFQALPLMVIMVVIYIAIAPLFFKTFFPQYMSAVIYSQIYSLILLVTPRKLMAIAAMAHSSKKHLYSISLASAFTRFASMGILIPLYGIAGAIASLLVMYAIDTVVLTFFFRRM